MPFFVPVFLDSNRGAGKTLILGHIGSLVSEERDSRHRHLVFRAFSFLVYSVKKKVGRVHKIRDTNKMAMQGLSKLGRDTLCRKRVLPSFGRSCAFSKKTVFPNGDVEPWASSGPPPAVFIPATFSNLATPATSTSLRIIALLLHEPPFRPPIRNLTAKTAVPFTPKTRA